MKYAIAVWTRKGREFEFNGLLMENEDSGPFKPKTVFFPYETDVRTEIVCLRRECPSKYYTPVPFEEPMLTESGNVIS